MTLSVRDALARLTGFTREDSEAKGLRRFAEHVEVRAPLYYSVAEMVATHPALLLHAPLGGGKTTLAKALATSAPSNDAALHAPLARNPESDVSAQDWTLGTLDTLLWSGTGKAEEIVEQAEAALQPVLMIFDGLPAKPRQLLDRALRLTAGNSQARLLILLDSAALDHLDRPSALPAYRLMPLPRAERAARWAADPVSADWCEPGLWDLSRRAGRALDLRAAAAAAAPAVPHWLTPVARALAWEERPADAVTAVMAGDGEQALAAFGHFVKWCGADHPAAPELVDRVLDGTRDLSVRLAAEALVRRGTAQADAFAQRLIERLTDASTFPLRLRIGEVLSRLGDPRDLLSLCTVPAGRYPMGSPAHPNSAPAHKVDLLGFRIAAVPVTVRDYRAFVAETGRPWRSPAQEDPSRQNHPATDVTWYDARSYCDWLTPRWRKEGRIGPLEVVRLPTEREWEAGARGVEGRNWPWGAAWKPLRDNGEESGFNDTCAVGLFPEGASPYGCHDMAGNVWEWCTTLWGSDMARPSFCFPWAEEDGREALDAAPSVRRVLRGGCFSSPEWKANCIYRGSLEPTGFWRGNGFRIVVA